MDSSRSHSHDYRDDVVADPEQIGFPKKHLYPEKQVLI